METVNPFIEAATADADDGALVERAKAGSREALEQLVRRHQRWIYNIAVRMIYHPQDAEDVVQEILIKVITKLGTFEGRSSFRTWLYRMVANHVLNMKRGRMEAATLSFADYGRALDNAPDLDLPDPRSVPVDLKLLVDEARIGCTSGMLLCLDREQRLVYVLGEILGVADSVAAELLEVTPDNFRQKLSRARRDLHNFMNDKCGLVNKANPCRCAKKTRAFMKAGYVDPQNLLFARSRVREVREVAGKGCEGAEEFDGLYAEIYRQHPFYEAPDIVQALRGILESPEFKQTFHLA